MKLTEALEGVGRPVAFYPGLRRLTGSTTATILLCQLFYWTGKEASGDGWIYKTSEQLEGETGLSYDEQVTARKHLVERELIEEEYKRLEHKMYFRVCLEKINTVWEIPETGIAKMGKDELPNSLNRTTETTAQTTTDIKTPVEKIQIDPVDHALEFKAGKSAELETSLAIESILKIEFGLSATGTKGGMEFVNHAVKMTLKENQNYRVFFDWWKVNFPNRQYWSFPKMRENWPAAFMDVKENVAVNGGNFYA